MILNIFNSCKVCYYNFLVYFYLCLNCIFPYYDEIIISMQINSIKLLLEKNSLNMRKIKRLKMIEFINTLENSDKILLDKEKDLVIIEYDAYNKTNSIPCVDYDVSDDAADTTEATDATDTDDMSDDVTDDTDDTDDATETDDTTGATDTDNVTDANDVTDDAADTDDVTDNSDKSIQIINSKKEDVCEQIVQDLSSINIEEGIDGIYNNIDESIINLFVESKKNV